MSRIDIGRFGGAVAPTVPGSRVPAQAFVQGDGGLGQSAMRAAGGLLAEERAEAERLRLEADREQKVNEERGRRNRAATVFATYQVDSSVAADDVMARLNDGQIKREGAEKELTERLATLRKQHVDPLDPISRADLSDNLIRFDGAASLKLTQGLREHAKKERAASFTQLTEAQQRVGVTDPLAASTALRVAYQGEGAALYGADQAAKHLQKDIEGVWKAHFTDRLNRVTKDARGLSALERDLGADKNLDPDAKNILNGRIAGFRNALEAGAERAAASRDRTLRAEIEAADRLILAGYPPKAEQHSALLQAARGTPHERVVQAQIEFGKQTDRFRLAPAADRQEFINNFERNVRQNPTADGVRTVEKYKEMDRSLTKAHSDDIVSWAVQNGITTTQPLDISQPAKLGDQLNARLDAWRGLRARYGGTSGLLMATEVDGVKRLLDGMQPKTKAEVLSVIASKVKDPVALRDTAAQIAGQDKSLGTALFLAAHDRTVRGGQNLAETYLLGQDAIATKSAKIDETREFGLRAEMTKLVDGVYLTTLARDTAVDVAMKLWASGRVADNGLDNVRRAVDAATGGIIKFNGQRIVKPHGQTESQFRDAINAFTPEKLIAQAGGVDSYQAGSETITAAQLAKMLPGAHLQTRGPGQYAIVAGSDFVRLPDRSPLIIEVR